jgi:uncharacterized protein (TIGR02594 family)
MSAGTSTPVEAGQGPNVLGIAMSIGAKIRDAAQDAKEEKEKAAEKGETPKKGSLFKSALANKFNPIKSKKAKSNWAKQFDWNKKTGDSPDTIKEPTTSDSKDGKAKLKEFIAGGFTAILKDTSSMVSKLDGVKMLTGENLSEVTRASSSLTLIKESIDAQTDLRRKALEEARYARAEKQLEKTKDVAGVSGPKEAEKKDDGGDSGGGGGGGTFDWLLNALGIADIASSIPGAGKIGGFLNKLNPFKKSPVTQGAGGKPPGPRMPGSGPKITTGGGAAAKGGANWLSRLNPLAKGAGGAASRFGLGRIAQGAMGLANPIGWGMLGGEVLSNILNPIAEKNRAAYKETNDPNNILSNLGFSEGAPRSVAANTPTGVAELKQGRNKPWWSPFSEGGMVPDAVPLARGGIVDNPTKTNLNPGDSVIPLNRNIGKQILGDTNQTTPGETALDTVGAMILGVSAGMLGKTESGSVGDQVKQDIRKASKQFGISNLTFTSSIGRGQFGKVDMNKDAKGFLMSLFKNIKIAGGDGKKSGGGGGDNNPPGGTPESLKADLEADIGKDASQMKDEIMQSGATGVVDPTQQPWCAAYVNSQLKRSGIQGSDSAAVNSFETWGAPVDKNNIKYGDVLVGDYGAGSKSHVMFAAGSPKDGAVEIIGGNQSGRVTRGTITLDKIDYVRRASSQPPALPTPRSPGQQPTPTPTASQPQPGANPSNNPVMANLPDANMTQLPIAQDGMIGPSWMPWNWGKVVDKHRSAKSTDYANPNSMLAQAARQREMMKELGYASGGTGGDKQSVMRRHAAKLTAQRATQQRALLGVVKGGGKNGKYTVTNTGMRPGESEEDWGQRTSQATRLVNRLNKEQGLNKPKPTPPRPAPGKSSSSSSGTRPAPRKTASPTAVSAVMPPKPMQQSTASAEGSFGSAVPAGKTSAMVFADFLYYDLV